MDSYDVTVIGAGPYGLSAAAHLRAVKGLEVRVFGEPMSFWSENMPQGMFLRSNWTATQIASPGKNLSLESFQAEEGHGFKTPVPLDGFVAYGLWYQRQAVPDLDRRRVVSVEPDHPGFRVTLGDGETVKTRRVVVAVGIGSFARRPSEFESLPKCLVSHTSDHRDLTKLVGKRVIIVGGGQSALESAALLYEAGAEVEVIARTEKIHWLQGWASKTLHHRLGRLTSRLLYAPTDVGPAGISQLMARPDLLKYLPRPVQDKLRRRSTRPAGARWLVDRLQPVRINLGCSIESVRCQGEQVRLHLGDGSERIADHVLLGTGFHIDVSKYRFLDANLIREMRRVNGFPLLKSGLETSIPGLHILGAPGVYSCGPLLQFVSGTTYASRTLLNCVTAGKQSFNGHQSLR
jgi:cation diffusion facilitator CzcD-associated flavoprotein CzcO